MSDEHKTKISEMEELSEEIIADKPWAQHLLNTVQTVSKKAVLNWCNTVLNIGETDVDVEHCVPIFLHHVTTLLEDLVADMDTIQEKSLDKIAQLLEQLEKLCRDLHVEMPVFQYQNMPLCELRRAVNDKVEVLEAQAETRKMELRELQGKFEELCERLGRQGTMLAESPLPSSKQVDNLRSQIEAWENEALEREERFFHLKEEILEIAQQLGAAPTLDFEREILNLTNRVVKIHDSEITQLQEYRNRLVKQKQDVADEISSLRMKVDDLWKTLEIDMGERGRFLERNVGNSLKILDNLKLEAARLDDLKKANIQRFVCKQREELKAWWDKCHVCEEDRKKFTPLHFDCYNEDLLELHERECRKWQIFYEESKELFESLSEYQKLWAQHLDLENNACSPHRLKNRGGQLLLEEQKRNKLKKRIPKVEESIMGLACKYQDRNGRKFLISSLTVQEYIQKLHNDEKQEFELKLSAKKLQRELSTPGGKRRSPLFKSSAKRRAGTPATGPPHKKNTSTTVKAKTEQLPKFRTSFSKRRSDKRKKRQKLFAGTNKENKGDSQTSSYDEFERDVTKQAVNTRSTGHCVKEFEIPAICVDLMESTFRMPGITNLPQTPKIKKGL